ncbi:MAG: helix-turn-helix transcriptional regulator [Bacilli bacterium]|nr:helix-turn-helix transcriptional regulator [Bacilli bacterium]
MNFSSIDAESYDKNTFGKCIRQQREENNMKLTEVASKVGITKVYLSDIERGNRVAPVSNTNLDKLYKLMKSFKYS